MAFFQFESALKKDKYLFSINESARAHRYISTINPFETTAVFIAVGAVLIFLVSFFCKNPQLLTLFSKQASVSGVLLMISGVVAVLAIFFFPRSYTHVCFAHHLRIHRSYMSKQPYRWVIAKDIEHLIFKEVRYKNEIFTMVKVVFNPFPIKFLGRPWSVRFGISDQIVLSNFKGWATAHGISIAEEHLTSGAA